MRPRNLFRKILWQLLACIAVVGALTATVSAQDGLRPKLGCVPLVAKNIEAMAFTEYLTTLLLNELDRSGVFEIAERKRLEAMMDLEGVRSDSMTAEQMQRLGVRSGVDFLVAGTVTSVSQGIQLDVRLLNLRGQRVVFTEQLRMAEAEANRALRELAARMRDATHGATALTAGAGADARPLYPPSELVASGSSSAIRLRWKHGDPALVIGYTVTRATSAEGPFNPVSTVTEMAYTDEALHLNETYYYRVAAVGRGGVSSEPSVVVRGATSVAPAAPIFMNVEPLLGGAVLAWCQRPFSTADERIVPRGVRIYRRTAAEKEFTPVSKSGEETTRYRDQGLRDGTTYFYAMTAYNQAGAESELSVQLAVTTPPAPAGVAVQGGAVRRIQLSWQSHPFEAVTGYRVYRAMTKDGPFQELASLQGRLQTSYMDTGLADNATYWYRVQAISSEQGASGLSEAMAGTTRPVPPAPVKVTATSGEPRKVTLRWESAAVVADELTGYLIYRGEPGQERLSKIAEVPASQTSYCDDAKPLQDGTAYSYVVASMNAGGAVSVLSARANATTKVIPAAPQGVVAVSGEPRKITLRWKSNAEKDVSAYLIQRQRDDGEFRELKRSAETSYVDTELKDSATHRYRMQAIDKDGLQGPFSAVVVATTKPLPKAVEGLVLKDKAARLLVWQKVGQADVKRYNLYKKSFFGSQKVATVEANEWRVSEPGKLELYVTAEDGDGLESEPSAVVTVE